MEIYKLGTAYDVVGNSAWDAVWYDGDYEDIDVVSCEMRLAAVWKAPNVRVENRQHSPDIYAFQSYYAMTERVCGLLSPLVKDTVEFLPLSTGKVVSLFVMHPLLRVDLDDRAVVKKNSISGNITVITKYSFSHEELQEEMHVFQVRQAPGSSSRPAGYPCSGVLVTGEFKKLTEEHGLSGIVCNKVFPE